MPTDSYFDRDGATIAYQYSGTGSPLAYAHGVPLSRDAVRRLDLLDLDALGDGRRLLTYDARGHGESTGRPIAADYTFDNFGQDLLALVDAIGIDEPIDFTGSSLGADTALRATIAQPDLFRRLVLMIPPAAWDDAPLAQHVYSDIAATIESQGPAAWREQWAAADPLPIFDDYPKFELTPAIDDELLASVFTGISRSDLPAQDRVATITQPTLILAWDTDPLHPVSTAHKLRDQLPNAELHVSATAADVATWTERITEFLA
ncbi:MULTISPECIES: alpha/beta fold hydrolase [Kribbella]|uniref:Alpha/beta hydrolase n=1 Tax=Kribbella sancticallisti TaxID=460087 RepID=A0ABP4QF84_9ACTN|nr:alpha/beta hydrolase [Kribbella catacumbae]